MNVPEVSFMRELAHKLDKYANENDNMKIETHDYLVSVFLVDVRLNGM